MCILHITATLVTFEAIVGSKWPLRTSESRSVISKTYVPMSPWPLNASMSQIKQEGDRMSSIDERWLRPLVKIVHTSNAEMKD